MRITSGHTIRMGLDFDNTMVCYDELFYQIASEQNLISAKVEPYKPAVKADLITNNKERAWTYLQGLVYGSRILEAKPFPGLTQFLEFCRAQSITCMLVSHKTKFPYLGKKIDLHKAAVSWLQKNKLISFFQKKNAHDNIYFLETQVAKANQIKVLNCTHFIDDLLNFLKSSEFPVNTLRYCFKPDNNTSRLRHDGFNQASHKDKTGIKFIHSWVEMKKALENQLLIHDDRQ